jgi:hypothetical protein
MLDELQDLYKEKSGWTDKLKLAIVSNQHESSDDNEPPELFDETLI